MNSNFTTETKRPPYVSPRIKSYTEDQVTETLGPVLLSGNGFGPGDLSSTGSQSSKNTGGRPRR